MLKKNRKIISLITLLSFLTTSIEVSSLSAFAADNSVELLYTEESNEEVTDLTHGKIQGYMGIDENLGYENEDA